MSIATNNLIDTMFCKACNFCWCIADITRDSANQSTNNSPYTKSSRYANTYTRPKISSVTAEYIPPAIAPPTAPTPAPIKDPTAAP